VSVWKDRSAAKLLPWHIGLLDWIDRKALVRQLIVKRRGGIPTSERLYDFYRHINEEVCDETAADFLEFGVYTGHSIRRWSQMDRDPQSQFIGSDSFEGLPAPWTTGALDVGGAVPQTDDKRVSFQNTLPGFLNGFSPNSVSSFITRAICIRRPLKERKLSSC
jgi:hypothetical protein